MTALTQALTLAGQGIPCFPCLASKAPACPGGFKAATKDSDGVRALWRGHAGPLIGTPTGAASGFDALDIDPRHGGEAWEQAHATRLPVTRSHATRSGGRHYLFRHHEGVRNSASMIAPGVDVRGDGGYIVWWPADGCAVLHDVPVASWPDWLLTLLLPKPKPALPPTPAPAPCPPCETVIERMIRRALYRLETAPAGGTPPTPASRRPHDWRVAAIRRHQRGGGGPRAVRCDQADRRRRGAGRKRPRDDRMGAGKGRG